MPPAHADADDAAAARGPNNKHKQQQHAPPPTRAARWEHHQLQPQSSQPQTPPIPPSLPLPRNRPCWECRRRRLACDSAVPECNKCRSRGLVCPGYANSKPVRWLPPGQVASRVRTGAGGGNHSSASSDRSLTITTPETDLDFDLDVADVVDLERDQGLAGKAEVKALMRPPLRTEICDLGDASLHYNMTVLPYDFSRLSEHNALINLMLPVDLTEASRSLLVVLALSKRSFQDPEILAPRSIGRVRMLHYKQKAIQELNRSICNVKTRTSDETFLSIWYSARTEINISLTPDWEPHFTALLAIIELRGGFLSFIDSSTFLGNRIFVFLIWAIVANTTRSSSDLIPIVTQPETKAWVKQFSDSGATNSAFPCPAPLFLALVEIGILRRAFHEQPHHPATTTNTNTQQNHRAKAADILFQIQHFSPQIWIASKTAYHNEWDLVTKIYHSSIAIFALATLEPILGAAAIARVQIFRSAHHKSLLASLARAAHMPVLKYSLLWPSMVAGFEAVRGAEHEREFVAQYLSNIATNVCVASPLVGVHMLRRFWESGKDGWDDCFDRPAVFCA